MRDPALLSRIHMPNFYNDMTCIRDRKSQRQTSKIMRSIPQFVAPPGKFSFNLNVTLFKKLTTWHKGKKEASCLASCEWAVYLHITRTLTKTRGTLRTLTRYMGMPASFFVFFRAFCEVYKTNFSPCPSCCVEVPFE